MYEQFSGVKIFDSQVNLEDMTSYNDFFKTGFMQNDILTDTIVWLQPNQWKQEFLLHTLTIGNALVQNGGKAPLNTRKKGVTTYDYTWLTMGQMKFTDKIASNPYATTAKPGANGESFFLTFQTPTFKKGYTISSASGYRVKILTDAIPDGLGYKYKCIYRPVPSRQPGIAPAQPFLPVAEVAVGKAWGEFWSDGNLESEYQPGQGNKIVPGKSTNQVNTLTATRSIMGISGNMGLSIKVPVGEGQESEYYIKQDEWMMEYRWMRSKETIGWYGQYNKNADGLITLTHEVDADGIGQVEIREGAGVLEQIPNVVNYSRLSYSLLKGAIMDIFFSYPNLTQGKDVTLITGQGGMEEFDRAMKDYFTSQYSSTAFRENDKLIGGAQENLELGGYFSKVYFVGGYSIKVIYNKSFDTGILANIQRQDGRVHPETGYPYESYRMVFLDTDNSDMSVNLQYVYMMGKNGESYEIFEGHNPGMIPNTPNFPASPAPGLVTSSKPESHIYRRGTCGWTLLNAATSLQFIYG